METYAETYMFCVPYISGHSICLQVIRGVEMATKCPRFERHGKSPASIRGEVLIICIVWKVILQYRSNTEASLIDWTGHM
jgi:hypothetical protein